MEVSKLASTPKSPPRGSNISSSLATPSEKRAREENTPPRDERLGKKIVNNKPIEKSSEAWSSEATFAEVVRNNEELQLAISTVPPKEFTGEDRLDFIDSMGELIFTKAVNSVAPKFENTHCRGNYLIVTAADKFSFDWLKSNVTAFEIWQGFTISVMPVADIPKLKKALLWLPGRKAVSDEESLSRLNKMNPESKCLTWKIFSRKEESHGTRFLIGIDESLLQSTNMNPYWSTIRGQITLTDDADRERNFKLRKRRQSEKGKNQPQGKAEMDVQSVQVSKPHVAEEAGRFDPEKGSKLINFSNDEQAKDVRIDQVPKQVSSVTLPAGNGTRAPNGKEGKTSIQRKKVNVKEAKPPVAKITTFLRKNKVTEPLGPSETSLGPEPSHVINSQQSCSQINNVKNVNDSVNAVNDAPGKHLSENLQ